MSEYLEHYGVLGMHWGIRKDGKPQGYQGGNGRKKSTSNSNSKSENAPTRRSDTVYTPAQRKRDEKIYSKKAVERIAKRIDDGESVQSARHDEVVRKQRAETTKRVGKRVAKTAISVVGGAAIVAAAAVGLNWVSKNTDILKNLNIDPNVADTGMKFITEYLNRWANPF